MTHRGVVRNGIRVAAVRSRVIAVCAAPTLLLAAAAVFAAGETPTKSVSSKKSDIALNQGVSLDNQVPDMDPRRRLLTNDAQREDGRAAAGGGKQSGALPKRKSTQSMRESVLESTSRSFSGGRKGRLSTRAEKPPGRQGAQAFTIGGVGALVAVLLLIGVVAWAVRRWMPAARHGDNGVLRIVGRANLSTKHSLALVQLGRRFVMVGVAGDHVTTLCEVSDEEEVAELAARMYVSGGQASDGFDQLLSREAAAFDEAGAASDAVPDPRHDRAARESEAFAGCLKRPARNRTTDVIRRKPLHDLLRGLRAMKKT